MNKNKSLLSLLPLVVFLLLYISIGFYFTLKGSEYAFYKFPASSCILIAFALALIQGFKEIKLQIQYFLDGIRDQYVVIMLLIFLLAGAFSAMMQGMGGVESTVNLGLSFIPAKMILPGLFLIACFVSMAMGTSMGTLAAVVPIAAGFAQNANLSMALTMGTVLGGAMFGDNLSIVSDTTIAATSTQKCSMKSKFKMNLKIIWPAFFIVVIALSFVAHPQVELKKHAYSYLKILPYFFVFILALLGANVIVILMAGIFLSGIIGLSMGSITFLQFGEIIQKGFMSMTDVIFLTFFISGLAFIAAQRGGLDCILNKLKSYFSGKKTAKIGIMFLVSLANICTANNTIAILFTGKMARNISQHYGILPQRTASLLDIFASAWQGVLPYGAQLLLIDSLAHVSPFSVIKYSWYPILLGVSGLVSILINKPSK